MGTCEHDIKDAYEQPIPKTLKALLAKQTQIMFYSDNLVSSNCNKNSSAFSYSDLMRLNLSSEWCQHKDILHVERHIILVKHLHFVVHICDLVNSRSTVWLPF